MLVLDYVRYLKGNSVQVPPFHTGHLGFIPGTEVQLGLMAPYKSASHCEIVVSPFNLVNDLAIIRCTMKDGVGVVKKLVDALSYLGINIETEESSSINYLNNHSINLMVDISTSDLGDFKTTRKSVIRSYQKYKHNCPVHDYRYLKIFEAIVAFCGDSIEYEDVSGEKRLSLYIRPVGNGKYLNTDKSTISSSENMYARIELPPKIIHKVKSITQSVNEERIPYLILSDTRERNLRIFFPKNKTLERLLHVGIYHKDVPGALSSSLELIANSDFNILTSLLRKQNFSESIWEAILEFKGGKPFPKSKKQEGMHQWVAETMLKGYDDSFNLKEYDLKVGNPLYPKVSNPSQVRINDLLGQDLGENVKKHFDIKEKVNGSIQKLNGNGMDSSYGNEMGLLLNTIKQRVETENLPSIFLSYPRNANKHARLIKDQFKERYSFIEYQDPDGDNIIKQVMERIKNCDYFMGIWHHDESLPENGGKFNVSPWMPFELGVALSENKDIIIIRSEKISDKVVKRLIPHLSIPAYSDLFFQSKFLKILEKAMTKSFK